MARVDSDTVDPGTLAMSTSPNPDPKGPYPDATHSAAACVPAAAARVAVEVGGGGSVAMVGGAVCGGVVGDCPRGGTAGELWGVVSLPDLRTAICGDIGLGGEWVGDEQNVALLLHQILGSGSFCSAWSASLVMLSAC